MLIIQEETDAGAGREGRTLGQAVGGAEGEVRFGLPVPEADEAQGVGIRDDKRSAVECGDVLEGFADGVLGRQWDQETGGHEGSRLRVHRDTEERGDFGDGVDVRIGPRMRCGRVGLLPFQHRVVGVERQKTGGGVRFAGVDVIDALGDPFGLLSVIHDADVGSEFCHARDHAGFHVQRQRKLARRSQTDTGRAAAEDTPAA